MSLIVEIARCKEHGLHGRRTDCYVCAGPVQQVRMVPVSDVLDLLRALRDDDLAVYVEHVIEEASR